MLPGHSVIASERERRGKKRARDVPLGAVPRPLLVSAVYIPMVIYMYLQHRISSLMFVYFMQTCLPVCTWLLHVKNVPIHDLSFGHTHACMNFFLRTLSHIYPKAPK